MKQKIGRKGFVIVFDLPRIPSTPRKIINRELRRINAEKIQDSFWKSENLSSLIKVAIDIRKFGGKASILEEKFLF